MVSAKDIVLGTLFGLDVIVLVAAIKTDDIVFWALSIIISLAILERHGRNGGKREDPDEASMDEEGQI